MKRFALSAMLAPTLIGATVGVHAADTAATFTPPKDRTVACPRYDVVTLVEQTRLNQLLDQLNSDKAKVAALVEAIDPQRHAPQLLSVQPVSSASIALGLSDVLVAAAKKAGITWLLDKTETKLCKAPDPGRIVLPNTCQAAANAEVVLPTISTLSNAFRRDVFSLPACLGLNDNDFDKKTSALDPKRADGYVIAALLASAYSLQAKDSSLSKDLRDNLPGAASSMQKADLTNAVLALIVDRKQAQFDALFQPVANCLTVTGTTPTYSSTCIKGLLAANTDWSGKVTALADDLTAVTNVVTKLLTSTSPENVVSTLQTGLPNTALANLADAYEAYLAASKGNYDAVVGDLAPELGCGPAGDAASAKPSLLCSRIGLVAEVASAKDQAGVDAALDELLSPGAQWMRKEKEFVVSAGAMVGAAAGRDTLRGGGASAHQGAGGLFLPVGVDFSWPTPSLGTVKHVAVFGSLLDLGAVATSGFSTSSSSGTTASASTNFKFSSVVSPGLYLAAGFDAPFRVGVGVSRVAGLRKITSNGTTSDADATRFQIFFAIDLTLFAR